MPVLYSVTLVLVLLSFTHCGIVDHQSQRVLSSRPLSDKERGSEGDGDYEYDHEAFLGEDQADYFDTLTPEESQRRLGVIFDRIDIDKDSKLSQEELKR